jgi:hypothetical protein
VSFAGHHPSLENHPSLREHPSLEKQPSLSHFTNTLGSSISIMAYFTPSRPRPLSFTPPYGIWSARKVGTSLMITPPHSIPLKRPVHLRNAIGIDTRLQPEPRVIQHVNGLLKMVEGLHGDHRAKNLLRTHAHRSRNIGQHGRCVDAVLGISARDERCPRHPRPLAPNRPPAACWQHLSWSIGR